MIFSVTPSAKEKAIDAFVFLYLNFLELPVSPCTKINYEQNFPGQGADLVETFAHQVLGGL